MSSTMRAMRTAEESARWGRAVAISTVCERRLRLYLDARGRSLEVAVSKTLKVAQPVADAPDPPAHLSERAVALWRELAPAVATTTGRRELLRDALETLDRLAEIRDAIRADGLTQTTPRSGSVHAHQLLRYETQYRALFQRAWSALGLDRVPSSFDDLLL